LSNASTGRTSDALHELRAAFLIDRSTGRHWIGLPGCGAGAGRLLPMGEALDKSIV
jgi:hypothetical protein